MVHVDNKTKEFSENREDELNYMWSMSPEVESSAVPQGSDPLFLDVFEQPSFPSPDYESEVGEAVLALDAYLSPRAEENMDFTLCDQESRGSSPSISVGSDGGLDFCLSFEDLLDPAVNEAIDNELADFLNEKCDKEVAKKELVKEEATEDVPRMKTRSTSKGKQLQVMGDATNNVATKENVEKSQVIILKQKDGTSKTLNVIPISRTSASPLQTLVNPVFPKAGSRPTSPVHKSARVIKCVRQERPGPPIVNNAPASTSKVQCMYPDFSETYESLEDKSRKNAIQAKMNREKKKAYITSLEGQVSELSKENQKLGSRSLKLEREKDSLAEEVDYLRSVLANQSALSRLLGNIPDVANITLSTSFSNDRKRFAAREDHDYVSPPKSRKSMEMSGGVCLHVANDDVSIEFCPTCSRMAKDSLAERLSEE